ncbi:MAG: helix-turn-helix domain-containing protein [bacterium JZ-2024 1]
MKKGETQEKEEEKLTALLARVRARQKLIERLIDPQLTLEEASLLLGISKQALRKYTNQGKLKCSWTPGGQRRFSLTELLNFYGKMDGEYLTLQNKIERLITSRISSVKRKKSPQKSPELFDES